MPETDRDPAPAVSRSLRILTLLADAGGQPIALSDIARSIGIAKSSTANLCLVLEEGGMIQRVPLGYVLGRRTAELGGAFAAQFNQVREFFSVCAASDALAHEVVQVAMLDGDDALYLARHEGRTPLRLGTPLGSRLPAALSATGNALLMRESDADVRRRYRGKRLPALTDRSLESVDALLEHLRAARVRGFAIDRSGSFAGITGIAVPLEPWAPSDPPLALGVALPESESDAARIDAVGHALIAAARELTNPLLQPQRAARVDAP